MASASAEVSARDSSSASAKNSCNVMKVRLCTGKADKDRHIRARVDAHSLTLPGVPPVISMDHLGEPKKAPSLAARCPALLQQLLRSYQRRLVLLTNFVEQRQIHRDQRQDVAH